LAVKFIGCVSAFDEDRFNHKVQIIKHAFRRDSDDPETLICKPAITGVIALGLITHIMRFAINFDDQSCGHTGKVTGHFANGMLPSEFEAARSQFQFTPQKYFWQRHCRPQSFSPLHRACWSIQRLMPLPH
jgi:hypothetical protein